METEGEKN